MLYQDEEGSRNEFLRLLAEQGEEPAFVTRRRRLDGAMENLRWSCRLRRRELLEGPRLQLRRLAAVIRGDWFVLDQWLRTPESWRDFARLHELWERESPTPVWANQASWVSRPARVLGDFYESVQRFNRAWQRQLGETDLGAVNALIDLYNRYYVLEKACAFGREDLAARGFEPIDPVTTDTLLKEFPGVTLPQRKAG